MNITKEFLEQKYLKEKIKVRDIAKQTGYSYSYLQRKIKKFNIPRHLQYKNLINEKCGMLTVKSFSHINNNRQAIWICRCECGNEKLISTSVLQRKIIKSCGCINKVRYGDITGNHFCNIKNHAKYKNLQFNINIRYLWDLFLKQNKKCALSGIDIDFDVKIKKNTTASLDRIDSSKGYIIGNVQWVHKRINQMKSNTNENEFLNWIKLIYHFKYL